MKKIDEQLQWFHRNTSRKEDHLIKANLKLINNLYEEIENSADRIFMDKIISTFCEIMEIQQDVIADLLAEAEQAAGCIPPQNNFVANWTPEEGFYNDQQLQLAFTSYLSVAGRSTYTINDYCSRIKNIWKTFYKEYKEGLLPKELLVGEEIILPDLPLLNAYHHTDELNCFINMKMAISAQKRNWANARAALNKLEEFKNSGK